MRVWGALDIPPPLGRPERAILPASSQVAFPRGSAGRDSKGRYIMGEFSPFHWLVVLAVVVLLFGGKKIPEVMRGLGEGIRSFKEGMRGDNQTPVQSAPTPPPAATTTEATGEKK
jgi:sec-independent protein translocase protein TatA